MRDLSRRLVRIPARIALSGVLGVAMIGAGVPMAQAQGAGMAQGLVKQKLETIKAAAAANQQKLHQYTWTETSTVTMNGHALPPKQSTCSYGPDGKVHKVPIASSGAERGGRLMERIKENKQAEMKASMQDLSGVIAMYVPPNPERMQKAFEAKHVAFGRAGNDTDLVFKDYAKAGDSMTLDFNSAAHRIAAVHVNTWVDSPQQPLKLTVDFGTLPDGTNHPSRTTLDLPAKGLQVVNVNSNYRKAG